jgi:hypothetical protein
LRLLPAQTAEDARSLLAWEDEPAAWTSVEPATEHSLVRPPAEIARWRYAVLTLPHPTLAHGLRILDMPGWNALPADPEGAHDLLRTCDLVVFVLSAETGLTASERAAWQQHVAHGEDAGRRLLVVLNKADTWWDADRDAGAIELQLQQQRTDAAIALGIAAEQVVSVSASAGRTGKRTGDATLIARSRIAHLEEFLCAKLFVEHHQRCQDDMAKELAQCEADMEQALHVGAQKRSGANERLTAQSPLPTDRETETLKIQAAESSLISLLEKIKQALQIPELDTILGTLDESLQHSEGALSVQNAYDTAQKNLCARWARVEHVANDMDHVLRASLQRRSAAHAELSETSKPLELSPYLALLQQALQGHIQFLGTSQVHKLKQADFTAKLMTALRARIVEISQHMWRDCEGWHARASQTLGNERRALQVPAPGNSEPEHQTADGASNPPPAGQAHLARLGDLKLTLQSHFLSLMEANAIE